MSLLQYFHFSGNLLFPKTFKLQSWHILLKILCFIFIMVQNFLKDLNFKLNFCFVKLYYKIYFLLVCYIAYEMCIMILEQCIDDYDVLSNKALLDRTEGVGGREDEEQPNQADVWKDGKAVRRDWVISGLSIK